jgi:LmbE family N-acetylglucosaminyl deacetylase
VIEDLGTIVGVWAHPDDEGYLSGGIMAAAVRAGQRVVCVTATRGEAADPARWPPAELATIREAELAACLAVLGVTEHRWLDYPDGGCAEVDPDAAAEQIAAIIDEVRADTVLTFGPDGQTGHPDHVAVSDWTERAAKRAAHPASLYFSTHTHEWVAMFEVVARDLDIMMGAEAIPSVPAEELAINFVLDDDLLALKERAMCQQATQVLELRSAMGADRYLEVMREEVFRLP